MKPSMVGIETLTISTLFKVVAKLPVYAKVQSVPVVIALLVANLGPLEDDFDNHVEVHGDDAKPQNPSLPGVADP